MEANISYIFPMYTTMSDCQTCTSCAMCICSLPAVSNLTAWNWQMSVTTCYCEWL